MGLVIQNNNINLTDASGNQRFTTEKRMPHLLLSASGTINVADAIGSSKYLAGTGYAGNPTASWSGSRADYTQDYTIMTDSRISSADSFIYPFFNIDLGAAATAGASLAGGGTVILNVLVDGKGYFRGVQLLTPVVVGNSVVLRVRTTIYDDLGELVNHTPYGTGTLVQNQQNTVAFSNTHYTIGYRVYYGKVT